MMQLTVLINLLALGLGVSAIAVPSPIDLIRRAHTTGTVITKCSKPGVLALAFDDGPYTCNTFALKRLAELTSHVVRYFVPGRQA